MRVQILNNSIGQYWILCQAVGERVWNSSSGPRGKPPSSMAEAIAGDSPAGPQGLFKRNTNTDTDTFTYWCLLLGSTNVRASQRPPPRRASLSPIAERYPYVKLRAPPAPRGLRIDGKVRISLPRKCTSGTSSPREVCVCLGCVDMLLSAVVSCVCVLCGCECEWGQSCNRGPNFQVFQKGGMCASCLVVCCRCCCWSAKDTPRVSPLMRKGVVRRN